MVRLAEVLSGVMHDVTKARVAADMISAEMVNNYQGDSILGQMPVPRFRIKDAEVTLRFAVNDHANPFQDTDLGLVGDVWASKVVDFAAARQGAILSTNDRMQLMGALQSQTDATKLMQGLEGNLDSFRIATQKMVTGLPSRTFGKLSINNDDARAILQQLRHLAITRSNLGLDLDVAVKGSALAESSNEMMQEIRFTVEHDDLDVEQPSAPLAPRERLGWDWFKADVEELEGVGEEYGAKLRAAGVDKVSHLLGIQAATLADRLDIPQARLASWVAMADLSRISGVDNQGAEVLMRAGITSAFELAELKPATVVRKVRAYLATVKRAPDDRQVNTALATQWVHGARQLLGLPLEEEAPKKRRSSASTSKSTRSTNKTSSSKKSSSSGKRTSSSSKRTSSKSRKSTSRTGGSK